MPTTSERRALILVTVLVCLGVAARVGRATRSGPPPTAAERRSLDQQIARVESARAAGRFEKTAAPDRRGQSGRKGAAAPDGSPAAGLHAVLEPRLTMRRRVVKGGADAPAAGNGPAVIDIDVATASELERLPYVGPALAARIVANRDSCGTFGSLDALKRVRGIGEGLTRRLTSLVTFSATSRPRNAAGPPGCARAEKARRDHPA